MENLISVVIPSYNGEKYIAETIQSIQNQDFPHEIIVIDDISTDKTVEISQDLGCKVIVNKEHKGQVAGKNTGIRESKGNYWLTIDQDDLLTEDALKNLYNAIGNNYIVMSYLKDFCSPDTPEQQRFCKPNPFWGILTGAALFKKEVFDIIGEFREDIITGDVIDLTTRLKKTEIEILKADFVTCNRRIHSANYGRTNQENEYKDYAKILREKLAAKL